MQELHSRETDNGAAHAHLSSYNIMINPSDFKVYIADYGLHSLKKYCKLFIKYANLNSWSPPEMWGEPNSYFSKRLAVDIYSFGLLLWELETGLPPFQGIEDKDDRAMRYVLHE